MVRPLEPSVNQVEEEEDSDEEIICTHLPSRGRGQPERSPRGSSGNSSSGNNNNNGLSASDAARAGLVAGGAGVAVPTLATAGLTAAGFSSTGVVAGSMAAGVQAGIGNVAAGSLFATCQSIGATGGFAILGPLGVAGALIGGTGYLGVRLWKNMKRREQEEEERRRREEEEQAKKKLQDDYYTGGGGQGTREDLCPECRKKLMLRLTRKYFKKK